MPVSVQKNKYVLPVSIKEVRSLWQSVCEATRYSDEPVVVRLVSVREIQTLNKQYHHRDAVTNVLTFSYPAKDLPGSGKGAQTEHDIVVCMEIATQEARQYEVELGDYVALLFVHAFLHAVGMDHENNEKAARSMHEAEAIILQAHGRRLVAWLRKNHNA